MVTWERKICWKGKILVVKTMYMGIGIQDIEYRQKREMDMDGEDMDTGWDLRWYPLSFYIHTVPMILLYPS